MSRVSGSGVGEMEIAETGVGEMGVGEMVPNHFMGAHFTCCNRLKQVIFSRGVARKCVMLKPNTFFQLKLLVFHNFFSERPGEIPYLKKSR